MLDQSTLVAHWKAKGLDFSKLFVRQKELRARRSITPKSRTIIWKPCSTAA